MRLIHLLFSICGFSATLQTLAQGTSSNVLTDEIDTFINQVIADWKSPGGVSVAVVRKNSQGVWNVETKGYGIATLSGGKVTENTRFGIGSNSKLFNILATGLLIHNETLSPRLSWTSKIASVIPIWGLTDPLATTQATITDLMSHRTGLPRHDFSVKLSDDVPTIIKKMRFQRPSAEFRDVWQYNNNMYRVLSYLPTSLLKSKISFARYVKQNIFDPLGMTSTTYSYQVANSTGNLADGMTRQLDDPTKPFGNQTVRLVPFWSLTGGEDGNADSGPGGVISSAADMATWLQTLLLGGVKPGTNQSVIPSDVITKVATGITVSGGAAPLPELSATVYGGGQIRGTYRGHEIIEHGGSIPGYMSVISRLSFDNIGVAVLSNDGMFGSAIVEVVKMRVLDEALGLEAVDWNDRYKLSVSQPRPLAQQRSANASMPSVSFQKLAGTYSNSGYGTFELCLITPNNTAATKSCKILASALPTILPGAIHPNIPTFMAEFNSSLASYIRLTHFNGNVFNVSGLNSYPTGNPAEPFWTSDENLPFNSEILAELGNVGNRLGFGITGIWGAPKPQGNTLQERAEVFFDKI